MDSYRQGLVSEGEEVEVHGAWKQGTLHARSMRNITTGADIVRGFHGGEKIVIAITILIAAVILTFVAGGFLLGLVLPALRGN